MRRLSLAALAIGLVATLAPTASARTDAPSQPQEAGEKRVRAIQVRLDLPRGPRFTDWGFDLKQECRKCPSVARKVAKNPGFARDVFGSGKVSLVRIALRADEQAVDSHGRLMPGWYADTVQAVANIRAANPDVQIYASRSTVGNCKVREDEGRCMDFAKSLKSGGRTHGAVSPWKYGKLLAEYLRHMNANGVPVTVLGIDNEPHANEANLTPARLLRTIKALDTNYGPPLPKLEANSPNNPDPDWWNTVSPELYRRLSIAAIHSHPDRWHWRQRRPAAQVARIAKAHGLARWNTELHWTLTPSPYGAASRSLNSVLNQLDSGYTAMVLWAYRPRNTGFATAQIQNALVDTIDHSQPVKTRDWDGDAARLDTLTSRAFLRGGYVYLWVVNDKRSFWNRRITFAGRHTGVPRYERWRVGSGGHLVHGGGTGRLENGVAKMSFPSHSVTLARIPLR